MQWKKREKTNRKHTSIWPAAILLTSFLFILLVQISTGLSPSHQIFYKKSPIVSTKNKVSSTNANNSRGTVYGENNEATNNNNKSSVDLYEVTQVVDGDTIKINYNDTETSVRLIGVNTPETVDPRKTIECFGKEASDYLKKKLEGQSVSIEADSTQTDRDKYNRLLRYIYLDGEDINLTIIKNGYGYEYTYNIPYKKQSEYKKAQNEAEKNNRGLWSPSTCNGEKSSISQPEESARITNKTTSTINSSEKCNIKGNISYSGEKIYHLPGQKYYNVTKIDTSQGERWFCSESEAKAAGWRKSKI